MKKYIVLALVLMNLSGPSYADLHVAYVKGMLENVQLSRACEHMNPILALLNTKQHHYTNIHNYLGSDPQESWIQSIFNAPAGTDSPIYFQVSPLARKFGRFLGPSTVGSILRLLPLEWSVISDEKFETDLAREMKKAILADSEFIKRKAKSDSIVVNLNDEILARERIVASSIDKELAQLEEERLKINRRKGELILDLNSRRSEGLNQCQGSGIQSPSALQLEKDILNIQSEFGFWDAELKKWDALIIGMRDSRRAVLANDSKLIELKKTKGIEAYSDGNLNEFIKNLFHASKASQLGGSHYPQHFAEQSLIVLAWLNTGDDQKDQFLELYRRLPKECFKNDDGMSLIKSERPWIKTKYTAKDYIDLNTVLEAKLPQERADFLLAHPEQAAFLMHARSFFDPSALPELGLKQVQYSNPDGTILTFPDCMESSILNFLAIVLKDSAGGVKIDRFKNVTPALKEFFADFPDSSVYDTSLIHHVWSALGFDIPGIQYLRWPNGMGAEITPSVDSIIRFFEHHVFGEKEPFQGSRKEKLDELCRRFSHDDLKLDWNLEGSKNVVNHQNTNLTLQFTLNGNPAFTWKLTPLHSEILVNKDSKKDWTSGLALKVASTLKEQAGQKIPDSLLKSTILSGLLDANRVDEVANILGIDRNSSAYAHLLYSVPLQEPEAKLKMMGLLLGMSGASQRMAEIGKIAPGLPLQDQNIQMKLVNLILEKELKESEAQKVYPDYKAKLEQIESLALQGNPKDLEKVLHLVIMNGCTSILERLIKAGVRWETKVFGRSLIQHAIFHHQMDLTEALLEKGPDGVWTGTTDYPTLLHYALEYGDSKILDPIARRFPDSLYKVRDSGDTLVHQAVSLRNPEGIEFLLKNAPHLFSVKNHSGETPFEGRIRNGDLEGVKFLVSRVPELLTEKQKDGSTPLFMALYDGRVEVAKYLIEKEPQLLLDVDSKKLTPLHYAAAIGKINFFKFVDKARPELMKKHHRRIILEAVKTKNLGLIQYIHQNHHPAITRFLADENTGQETKDALLSFIEFSP